MERKENEPVKQQGEKRENEISIDDCCTIMNVQRQSLYVAIKNGRIKANKIGKRYFITKSGLYDYMKSKYKRMGKKSENYIFDPEEGPFPPAEAARMVSKMLMARFTVQKLYYMLRMGEVKGYKIGGQWAIKKCDLADFYKREKQKIKEYIENI